MANEFESIDSGSALLKNSYGEALSRRKKTVADKLKPTDNKHKPKTGALKHGSKKVVSQ